MIARIAFLVFALIVLGGMYYLLLLAYRVLDLAEQLVDRQYGPALPSQAEAEDAPPEPEKPRPTPGPRTEPDGVPANGGLKAARLTAAQEIEHVISPSAIDPEFADMLAEHERLRAEFKARVDAEMAAERRERMKGAK